MFWGLGFLGVAGHWRPYIRARLPSEASVAILNPCPTIDPLSKTQLQNHVQS